MEETRQKLFLQLFVMATVISLSLILTVYIASTYYKDVANLSFWTPVPSDTLTDTPVTPIQPTPTHTPTRTATPTPTMVKDCTHSALYWLYHPEAWPPQIVVGSLTYTKEEAIVTIRSPNPDSAAKLFAQLHAAILNNLTGADFEIVRQTTIDAGKWLTDHPAGAQISAASQQTGLSLMRTLEDYNNGLTGPGRCADEPAPPAPTDTPTPQISPTPTVTVSETPASPRYPLPTKTTHKTRPPATRPPAINTPKPPTNTPRPPTNTPKPPTKPPPTPVP